MSTRYCVFNFLPFVADLILFSFLILSTMSKIAKTHKNSSDTSGLKIPRVFTKGPGSARQCHPKSYVNTNPDGSIVFEMKDVEVPTGSLKSRATFWRKYFRKKGVPDAKDGRNGAGGRRSAVHRLAGTWRH